MALRRKRVLLPASGSPTGGKILKFRRSAGKSKGPAPSIERRPSENAPPSANEKAKIDRAEHEAETYFAVMDLLSKVPDHLLWTEPHLNLLAALERVFNDLVPMEYRSSMPRRVHNEAREGPSGASVWQINGQDFDLAEGWRAYYLAERTGPKTSRGYRIATPKDIDPIELEGLLAQLPPSSVGTFLKFMQSAYGWTRI